MFIRLLYLTLVISFIVQPVTASEITQNGLNSLYNEFHYSMTVEWDQKDKEFLKKTQDFFREGLERLKSQGMTNEELLKFSTLQIKDQKTKNEFNQLITNLNINSLKPSEVNHLVDKMIKESYQNGASWRGLGPEAISGIVLGVIALAIVLAIVIDCTSSNGCETNGSSPDPNYYDYDSAYSGCTTYYDEYGEWEECY